DVVSRHPYLRPVTRLPIDTRGTGYPNAGLCHDDVDRLYVMPVAVHLVIGRGKTIVVDLVLHGIVDLVVVDRRAGIRRVPARVIDEHVEWISAILLNQVEIARVNQAGHRVDHGLRWAVVAVPGLGIGPIAALPERSPEEDV